MNSRRAVIKLTFWRLSPLVWVLQPLRCWLDCPVPGQLCPSHPSHQNLPVKHVQDPILLVQCFILLRQISPDLTVACAKLVYIGLAHTWARQLHLVKVQKLHLHFQSPSPHLVSGSETCHIEALFWQSGMRFHRPAVNPDQWRQVWSCQLTFPWFYSRVCLPVHIGGADHCHGKAWAFKAPHTSLVGSSGTNVWFTQFFMVVLNYEENMTIITFELLFNHCAPLSSPLVALYTAISFGNTWVSSTNSLALNIR